MNQSSRNLPVPVGPVRDETAGRRRNERGMHGQYGAQLYGQSGVRRGLKAGAPAIDQAHGAYQGAEWSGSADRRRAYGAVARLSA